jgi:hypothetical protein
MVVIWFSLQRQKEQAVLILDAEAVQYYVAKDYPVWYVIVFFPANWNSALGV